MNLDEQAKEWLKQHAHELEPEELPSEEEKIEQAKIDGTWPVPKVVQDLGVFAGACTQDGFNKIVGDPNNWPEILYREDLFEQWIVPNAVILFGKHWFDRVKWKNSIHRGVPFPLFSREDKNLASNSGIGLEDTPAGKSVIAKIISKTSYALGVYLQGKWFENSDTIKKPGGYIIDSIKNDLVRDIGADLGFKLKVVPACPYCMGTRERYDKKTPLVDHGSRSYSCNKCSDLCINLDSQLESEKDQDEADKIKHRLASAKKFRRFIGVTCVCPSDDCTGKFVPLSSIDVSASTWDSLDKAAFKSRINLYRTGSRKSFVPRNVYAFVDPPKEIEDLPLACPYCDTRFTPRSALESKSGFKGQSGKLTGLPTISIWNKKSEATLDGNIGNNSDCTNSTFKDNIPDKNINLDDQIIAKQKVNILIGEVAVHMSKLNKNTMSGLLSWYFFEAAIRWMRYFWEDAAGYFFGWNVRERNMTEKEMEIYPGQKKKKVTDVVRGREIAIHQSFFHMWMNVLDHNIENFQNVGSGIRNLGDFKWFCRAPKFSGGPKSTFRSEVDSKKRIANKTNIVEIKSKRFDPRLGVVLSIYKVENGVVNYDCNYVSDIKFSEWQVIRMTNECSLNPGDIVRVEALIMPGHPTHSPFQRMMRLRTAVLGPIINRVIAEEKNGERDILFWKNWNQNVKKACESSDLDILKE